MSEPSWYMVSVCVQRRQLNTFTGLPESDVYSFNLLCAGPGAPLAAVLDDIYEGDPTIAAYHLVDARYCGTLADYERCFGRDGDKDKRKATD